MKNSKIYNMFRFIAMAGNTVFVLWILRNGINEGFKGKLLEVISYISLLCLLVFNIFVIYRAGNKYQG